MPAENKLRKIFGLNEITEYKDLICLQGYEVTDLIDEARSKDAGDDQENEEDINDENSSNAGMNEEMPDADNNSGASGSADAAAPDDTSGSPVFGLHRVHCLYPYVFLHSRADHRCQMRCNFCRHPRRHRQEAGPRLRGRGLSACSSMLLTPFMVL